MLIVPIVLASVVCLASGLTLPCPPGWQQSESLCYRAYPEPKGWYEARDICRKEGGELASITSSVQNRAVWGYSQQLKADVWVGLNKFNNKRSFEWCTKRPLGFTNWLASARWRDAAGESCGAVTTALGLWVDTACTRQRPFVCGLATGRHTPGFVEVSSPNDKCVDVEARSSNVIAFPCNGGDRQRFYFYGSEIRLFDGKCLTVGRDGRDVEAAACTGADTQVWIKDGKQLRTKVGRRCLDLEGGLGGSNLIVHECHGGENQKWKYNVARNRKVRRECSCWGDPHCRDWLGRKFEYQGMDDHLMADVDDYRVEVDLYKCGARVTCVEAVTVVSPSKQAIEFSLKNKQPRTKCQNGAVLSSGAVVDGMLLTHKGGNSWLVTAGHLEVSVVVGGAAINVYPAVLGDIGDADVQGGFCTGQLKGSDVLSPDGARRGWAGQTWSDAAALEAAKRLRFNADSGFKMGNSWRLLAKDSHVCITIENPQRFPPTQPVPEPPQLPTEGPVLEAAKGCCKVFADCPELFNDCVLDHVVMATNGVVKCVDQGDVTEHVERCKGTAVDCAVGDWGSFTACSAKCGGGTMTRTRAITVLQQGVGKACPATSETVACNLVPCPVDCAVGEWSAVSACSRTCGGGVATRTRAVITAEGFGGKACPATSEVVACNELVCPVNCEQSEWSEFSACSASCGDGVQKRTRRVLVAAANGGSECGPTEESAACNLVPCPVDCKVGEWAAWCECSTPCGAGVSKRTRSIDVASAFGGAECLATEEVVECNKGECPRDCVQDEWTVGPCSASCGEGTRTKTRSILIAPVGDGAPCGPSTVTEACPDLAPCVVDCKVGEWGVQSACSKTCGGGVSTRTRSVTVAPQNGGSACPATSETVACAEVPCPVDCVIEEWSEWSPCDKTCGGGNKFRSRTVRAGRFGGAACPSNAFTSETASCSEEACCIEEPFCPAGRTEYHGDDASECSDCLTIQGCTKTITCALCNREPVCPATHRLVADLESCPDCTFIVGCTATILCTPILSLKDAAAQEQLRRPLVDGRGDGLLGFASESGFLVGLAVGVAVSAGVVIAVVMRRGRRPAPAPAATYELLA